MQIGKVEECLDGELERGITRQVRLCHGYMETYSTLVVLQELSITCMRMIGVSRGFVDGQVAVDDKYRDTWPGQTITAGRLRACAAGERDSC
jgi:hypothetical protein